MTSIRITALLSPFVIAGCAAPSGVWQLVEVEPPGAPFPFTEINLDKNGSFRAAGKFAPNGQFLGKTRTTTGKLDGEFGQFRVLPDQVTAKGFTTRVRLDGKLEMTLAPPGRQWSVKGIFRRVDSIDGRLSDPGNPVTPQSLRSNKE